MMQEYYTIIVPIKEDLKKKLIFGFRARPPIGLTLSYFGFQHEVMLLMHTLSHSTRAFIWNADGLNGFLIEAPITMQMFEDAEKSGELKKILTW